jgi:hypothetical protein
MVDHWEELVMGLLCFVTGMFGLLVVAVQATLSTIGDRLGEVSLPFPKDSKRRKEWTDLMAQVVETAGVRAKIRQSLQNS